MKAYVILRKGFEYDDNIYNTYDGGGGTPDRIVFDKDEAMQKVYEANLQEYKQESLNLYTYDIEEILNVEKEEYFEFCDSLIKKYGPIEKKDKWSSTENTLHPMANDEEAKKYDEMVSLSFFEWSETEVDMQSFRNYRINETLG